MVKPDPDALLANLDDDQRVVAAHPVGPMCVRAGAGTGKTRAITYRIAYGVQTGQFAPTNVLAVTFTQRAAAEMSARLRTLGVGAVPARTFHSAALSQLRFFWPSVVGGPMPTLVPHKAPQVVAAASQLGIRVDRETIRDLSAEIEWAAVSLVGDVEYAETVAKLRRPVPADLDAHTMAQLLRIYQETKSDRGILDFEDVLTLTCGMLEQRRDVAKQVRAQYQHFVVDEYQDVSPLQARLLELWLGGRDNVCVVGDAAQTIYSFTGATDRYLREFTTTYPNARVVELSRDYRSTPQVVSLANHLMAKSQTKDAVHLKAMREGGPAVQFATYADDEEEATQVAQAIADLIRAGVPARDIAVLYRMNAQAEAIETALGAAGIGYLVHGNARFFDRDDVRKALLALRAALTVAPASTGLRDAMIAAVEQQGWQPEAPETAGAVRERWDHLNALVELAGAREGSGLTLKEFVAELTERQNAQAAPEVDGVTLSSLHAAKGLEWEAVFLIGCSDGLLPLARVGKDPDAIEEERRLTYVGVTRAKRHLRLSFAKSRSAGGRATRKPSRFLTGVWPIEGGQKARAPKSRHAADAQKQFLAGADPADIAVFERLRAWRMEVATLLGLPAYVVLTDVALRDIATARPRTLKHLGMLKGIGPVKLHTFGPAVLAVIADGDLAAEARRAAAAWAARDTTPELG